MSLHLLTDLFLGAYFKDTLKYSDLNGKNYTSLINYLMMNSFCIQSEFVYNYIFIIYTTIIFIQLYIYYI